ncbi:MAG: ACP S-malonyltransferase [Chromatiaceae bacterium]|nr:ACP S-malonyltransferase [Chromatiaceae bacterium]
MASILAMFPGQGSQYVGMGKELCDQYDVARRTFSEADEALGFALSDLCFDGPESELRLTANQQPAILTTSVATWRILTGETDLSPKLFAGHSLGEYSALVAAGKLDFSHAVKLVRMRGQAMQRAVPEGTGAMAAVIGLDPESLIEKCSAVDTRLGKVEVVNFNGPQQQIISGHKEAVDALAKTLADEKIRCAPLPVSAPFHSSLMAPAREEMTPQLESTPLEPTAHSVIANLTGRLAQPYSADNLIRQIDSPVLWTDTLATAVAEGCDTFFEIGPGKVLFGLARKAVPRGLKIIHSDAVEKAIEGARALTTQ